MVVTKTFNVDLVRLEVPPTWACMQGDANSRAICYRLYADGLSYEIPSGVSLRIAYEKADKTSGVYSQLPDGSSAYEISGNTVTIRLIEDISAKAEWRWSSRFCMIPMETLLEFGTQKL